MGHASLRRGRWSAADQIYLVTFTTFARRRCFASFAVAATAARAITTAARDDARLLAWVLMPDHGHVLLQLGARQSLAQCVQRLKGCSARAVRLADPSITRVWAPAFHDRALRAEDHLRAAARYLVANPLRAGLVARIGDYPFWDAIWLDDPLSP